jgi:2-oxo-3-hexenedioate decarboxylase
MSTDAATDFIARSADRLFAAARDGQLVDLLSASVPTLDVTLGYAIQDALLARHVADGAVITGAKLGLTSIAKQVEMHVHEPIGGWLTDRMALATGEPLLVSSLVQPRCEPEIAFLLGSDLAGPDISAADVTAATDSLMVAIEVLDSRYRDYRFTLLDVIADDASAARFVVGAAVPPSSVDRVRCAITFHINGTLVGSATGAAVMGDPAEAVAWWVRHLATSGRGLRAGMVVLSGALMGAHKVAAGDVVRASVEGLGTLELDCR